MGIIIKYLKKKWRNRKSNTWVCNENCPHMHMNTLRKYWCIGDGGKSVREFMERMKNSRDARD